MLADVTARERANGVATAVLEGELLPPLLLLLLLLWVDVVMEVGNELRAMTSSVTAFGRRSFSDFDRGPGEGGPFGELGFVVCAFCWPDTGAVALGGGGKGF